MTKPNEPTLTCSEVVERLEKECLVYGDDPHSGIVGLDRKLAEQILHSWRERRVQELGEALVRAERKLRAYIGVCTGDKELTEAVLPMAQRALANSEWREQIRKGAKHEL